MGTENAAELRQDFTSDTPPRCSLDTSQSRLPQRNTTNPLPAVITMRGANDRATEPQTESTNRDLKPWWRSFRGKQMSPTPKTQDATAQYLKGPLMPPALDLNSMISDGQIVELRRSQEDESVKARQGRSPSGAPVLILPNNPTYSPAIQQRLHS